MIENANGLTCRELVELITEYLEGALPPSERVRFEAHLAECPPCTNYLRQMRQTIHAVGALRAEAIAPEQRATLLALFRQWKSGGSAS